MSFRGVCITIILAALTAFWFVVFLAIGAAFRGRL